MTARKVEWGAEAAEDALAVIATRDLSTVELMFGDAMLAVSGCLRGLFVAAPGHDLICADYSAIEAVGLAVLAGEQWRIDVFRTHGKIYEASAAQMFKVPLEEILSYPGIHGTHHPLRKKGKVSELAFGYQGWIGSARAFGMPGTDDEIKADIIAWRNASPAVVELWGGQFRGFGRNARPELYGCEGMLIRAIQEPGREFPVMRLNGTHSGLTYQRLNDVVYMILPDDSTIAYHRPRMQPSKDAWRGLSISYEGYNTNAKYGPPGWQRMGTWGGRQVENADQAVCNRILRHSQVNLEAAGYPIVQHVYDENVSEIPHGFGSVEEYLAIMGKMPPWAADWPIRAAGAWRGRRYRK